MLRLRPATFADRATLEHWNTFQHVIDSGALDDGLDWSVELGQDADWQETLLAEVDGVPIGVVQVIDPLREATHYWGEVEPNLRAIDIWIGPRERLGRGHGTEMMTIALDRCFSDSAVTAVIIDPVRSNEGAIRFYRRLGFVDDHETVLDDETLVMRLDRHVWVSSRS